MKKIFEIEVYNKEVREVISDGKSHSTLNSKWADLHLIEVKAHTSNEALQRCRRQHPERLGFIIGKVTEALTL